MNQTNIRNNSFIPFFSRKNVRPVHPGAWMNKPLALIAVAALAPVWFLNIITALVTKSNVMTSNVRIDALGREVKLPKFECGYFKKSAVLLEVLAGRVALVGASVNHTVDFQSQIAISRQYEVLPGLTSLQDIHNRIGLEQASSGELMRTQLQGSTLSFLSILFKSMMNWLWFNEEKLAEPKSLPLFGLEINNVSMNRAVDWAVKGKPLTHNAGFVTSSTKTQVAFFVNTHSVNTLAKNDVFKTCLDSADALFADGSGMRMAAKSVGFNLVANVNGTDMLPVMCEQAVLQGKSIYLLGGGKGIAEKAAANLKKAHKGLEIAGCHHGYFGFNDADASDAMVKKINESGADIVLVGFGSPQQEFWCQRFAQSIDCQTVMAVGGLFDFFSGSIPRAPLFMREIGMEWVWRLIQEPKNKFSRYVIGTPEFLIRTFLMKQA